MKHSRLLLISLAALLVAFLAGAGVALANPRARPQAAPAVPTVVSYQGQVQVGGSPFSGTGYCKFAVVNATGTTSYWSNDGSSTAGAAPGTAVALPVTGGLFTVLLGDTTVPNMTEALSADVFANPDRLLRVWFSADGETFTRLAPDRRIAAVPFALQAAQAQKAAGTELLGGLPAGAFQQHRQHVVVVAKSGGDYATIGAALASIADNGPDSRYLIWVAPGTYDERVTIKPYVDIEGAGELATTITSGGDPAYDMAATVTGAGNAELRSLTVENTGGYAYAVAIYNSAASPRLTHVTAYAHNATTSNYGVFNNNSSSPQMTNLTATASGGTYSYGVSNSSSSPRMASVTATASDATYLNYGVHNDSSSPQMTDVTATASGGTYSYGVYNYSSSPNMLSVTAAASEATDYNYGVHNYNSSSPEMRDVTATASGGANSYGVYSYSSSPRMASVAATASGAGNNYGVYNELAGPMAMVRVSAAASGSRAWAIHNQGTTLTMTQVTATAMGTFDTSVGVYNLNNAKLTVRNSRIAALGSSGANKRGIQASGAGTVRIDGSHISGATNSILGNSGHTFYVGATQLNGPLLANGATFHCAAVYDQDYAAFICP